MGSKPRWKPGDPIATSTSPRSERDHWQPGETETTPIPGYAPKRRTQRITAAAPNKKLARSLTAQRAAKGDVEAYAVKDGAPKGARSIEYGLKVKSTTKRPLSELLARHLISEGEYHAGTVFGSTYERATREVGAINLDAISGGRSDGLALNRIEAMTDLERMVKAIGETAHDRLNRARILIGVTAEQRSIRDLVGDGARARQTASNMLCVSVARLESFLAAEREAAA